MFWPMQYSPTSDLHTFMNQMTVALINNILADRMKVTPHPQTFPVLKMKSLSARPRQLSASQLELKQDNDLQGTFSSVTL